MYQKLGFNTDWYLKDKSGNNVIAYSPPRNPADTIGFGTFVDFTNPKFLEWSKTTLINIMQRGFDGIGLDDVMPLESYVPNAKVLIGDDKVKDWNNAIVLFAKDLKQSSPNKTIIYNNHHYDLLDSNLDGMIEEHFCYQSTSTTSGALLPREKIIDHIDKLQKYTEKSKILFAKDNRRTTLPNATAIAKTGRFCYGAFLMGFRPGYGFYKFSQGYGFAYLDNDISENALEINIDLGNPLAPYQNNNDVFSRTFSNGIVYVNLSSHVKQIVVPENLQLMNGGVPGPKYTKGQIVSLPTQDANFFVKNSIIPADFNSDGKVDSKDYVIFLADYPGKYTLFDYAKLVARYNK